MRTRTAEGYRHELGIYSSDEEFGGLICPFALGGLAVGEPVVLAYEPQKTALLQRWLPDDPGIAYVAGAGPYATPAKALVIWRKLVEHHLAAGAVRVRIAGDVPHPGHGRPYAGWDRYEAAIDRAWGDLPVWASCLYDARTTPADVLEVAERHHHHLLGPIGTQRPNRSFEESRSLADFLTAPADPLERTTPVLELGDPTPARARAAVSTLGRALIGEEARMLGEEQRVIREDELGDLVVAVSETVANALLHGVPPVTVRVWAGEGRVIVAVHDVGDGPADPLVGLLPGAGDGASGRGLWLAHLLDIDVALFRAANGFTVRLRAGATPVRA